MGFKEWMNYKKRKNLYIFGAVILALNAMVWTRGIISPFLSIKVVGTMDVATFIGIGMAYGTYLFWQGTKLG